MKNLSFALMLGLFFCFAVSAQNAALNIIPQPKSVTLRKGEFKLNCKTKIVPIDDWGRPSAETNCFTNSITL